MIKNDGKVHKTCEKITKIDDLPKINEKRQKTSDVRGKCAKYVTKKSKKIDGLSKKWLKE